MYASLFMKKKINKLFLISYMFGSIGLLLSVYLESTIFLIIILLFISIISWINSKKNVKERNPSHHIVRLIIHLIFIVLWVITVG